MFQIKICGITTLEDALETVEAGADAIGLNFYPPSPRSIDLAKAVRIVKAIPPHVSTVGVFVNWDVGQIVTIAQRLALDYIQLHGDEPPEQLAALARWPVIRAFRCDATVDQRIASFLSACGKLNCAPAGLLIDASQPGAYGGTGKTANWDQVRQIISNVGGLPVILAGGLRPDNVLEAVARSRPDGVDTASGVESSPGRKSARLMSEFVAQARRALEAVREGPAT